MQTPMPNSPSPPGGCNDPGDGPSALPEKNPGEPEGSVRAQDGLPIPRVETRNRYVTFAICGMLLLAVGLAFGQTARFEFIGCDDDRCVYRNSYVTSGFTLPGIVWALTHQSLGISGWAPLTLFSHTAVWQC